jgi:hypothetical protein
MSILYNPRWRLGWSVVAAIGAAILVGIDWILRVAGVQPSMAPTVGDLWLSLALGAALGGAAALYERHLLLNHRSYLLDCHRAPLSTRLSWRFQRTNLLQAGWLLVATLAFIGWCIYSGVFVLPGLLVENVVLFAWNRKLVAQFKEEMQKPAE